MFGYSSNTTEILRSRLKDMMDGGGKALDLRNLYLTKLPELPEGLEELRCGGNRFVSIDTLPDTLIYLSCDDNRELTALPDKLPEHLSYLDCGLTSIFELPPLPRGLEILWCSQTPLTELPELPPGLVRLHCAYTSIKRLPDLPDSLEVIECNDIPLEQQPASNSPSASEIREMAAAGAPWVRTRKLSTVRPGIGRLPRNLKILQVSRTPIEYLPELPNKLEVLYCRGTYLREIPDLPDSLTNIDLGDSYYLREPYKYFLQRYYNSYDDDAFEKFKKNINEYNLSKRGRNLAAFQQTIGRPAALYNGRAIAPLFSEEEGAMSLVGKFLTGERGGLRNQRKTLMNKKKAGVGGGKKKRRTQRKRKQT